MSKRMMWAAVFCLAAVCTKASSRSSAGSPRQILIVTAHPDDESEMAATIYRLATELEETVDQLVITNGEAGYRYSLLAERLYRVRLTEDRMARSHLPAIRRDEVLHAGRILGVRNHYFLNQRDPVNSTDPFLVLRNTWDVKLIQRSLVHLVRDHGYQFVLTLLPTAQTHGQHQAATFLTLEAVHKLPEGARPVVLGVATVNENASFPVFTGRTGFPLSRPLTEMPAFSFDRDVHFGFHQALSYQIVVNWVIAAHKSQGLFQTEVGKRRWESFWIFSTGPGNSAQLASKLFDEIKFAPTSSGTHDPPQQHR